MPQVNSNNSADRLKLYAGIGAAGLAAGAAIAVANDPIYDDEKKLRGKEVKRNAEWDNRYTKAMLDPLDGDMHAAAVSGRRAAEALSYENQARRNFHSRDVAWQQDFIKQFEHGEAGFPTKGSFVTRMRNQARKLTKRL